MTFGDADLLPDDIDAGQLLRDGVLDLKPRVHLHEPEFMGSGIDQELDRAGVDVTRLPGRPDRAIIHGCEHVFGQLRRRDLQELLMPALNGAVAGAQVNDLTVPVRQDLNLHVPGRFDELLHVNAFIVEGRKGFRPRLGKLHDEVGLADDFPDSPSAAARGGLQHDRVSVFVGEGKRFVEPGAPAHQVSRAGNEGNTGPLHDLPGHDLVAEIANDLGRRTDENNALFLAGL